MAADEREQTSQSLGQDGKPGSGEAEWKPDELKWRRREIVVQGFVALAALGAVILGIRATVLAQDAVETTRDGIERQANEDRLSTAIEAVGGSQPGGRVGGLALLSRHVKSQVAAAIDEEGSDEDAAALYAAALDVLENYLRNPPKEPTGGGLGYGAPDVPTDNVYAANQLEALVSMRSEVEALDVGTDTGVDLARVQLHGQPWSGIDFSWLNGHFFAGIDLRGASLQGSVWGGSDLTGAFLQCADLDGATFDGTDLSGADLRGANISEADFSGAIFSEDTKIDPVWYDGNRLPKGLDERPQLTEAGPWEGVEECTSEGRYWTERK